MPLEQERPAAAGVGGRVAFRPGSGAGEVYGGRGPRHPGVFPEEKTIEIQKRRNKDGKNHNVADVCVCGGGNDGLFADLFRQTVLHRQEQDRCAGAAGRPVVCRAAGRSRRGGQSADRQGRNRACAGNPQSGWPRAGSDGEACRAVLPCRRRRVCRRDPEGDAGFQAGKEYCRADALPGPCTGESRIPRRYAVRLRISARPSKTGNCRR